MRKVVEFIVVLAVMVFILSMLICCILPHAPEALAPIVGVSFLIPTGYCMVGYNKPIKYSD